MLSSLLVLHVFQDLVQMDRLVVPSIDAGVGSPTTIRKTAVRVTMQMDRSMMALIPSLEWIVAQDNVRLLVWLQIIEALDPSPWEMFQLLLSIMIAHDQMLVAIQSPENLVRISTEAEVAKVIDGITWLHQLVVIRD